MRPRFALTFCAAMLLAASGCQWPWQPKSGPIVGTVRYPDGSPVWGARVHVQGGDQTYTGADGRFWLPVPARAETLEISARDGFTPGLTYAETHFGGTRARAEPGPVRVVVVLDHSIAI